MKQESIKGGYGLVARYDTPEALVRAATQVRAAGYTRTDALTPFPVAGLAEALGLKKSPLAALVFAGGLAGALLGFGLQYWASIIQYPHVVSGRPLFSWPSFIPVTFCCLILSSAFTAFVGMLVLNGLPRPYHPLFSAPGSEQATTEAFLLVVESADPLYRTETTRDLLQRTGARLVEEVPAPGDAGEGGQP